MEYLTKSYTPIYKTVYTLAPTTTLTIWSPASGKKIGLTDLIVSTQAGVAGTFRIYEHSSADVTVAPTMVLEGVASSMNVNSGFSKAFGTPILVAGNDGVLRIVASFNGFTAINCLGFES